MPEDTEKMDTEAEYEPERELIINDLDTLKAIADPLRVQILHTFLQGPRTVKQIAASLGMTPTKLYYHINQLEEHGIIRVISTRVVSGIIEKQYHSVAYSFQPAPSLFSPGSSDRNEGLSMVAATVLDYTKNEIYRSIDAGLIDKVSSDETQQRTFLLAQDLALLSTGHARELLGRIQELMSEYTCKMDEGEESRVYGITIAMYPTEMTSLPQTMKDKQNRENHSNE